MLRSAPRLPFALAVVLALAALLLACPPPGELPEPDADEPRDEGEGRFPPQPPCGSLQVELVQLDTPRVRSQVLLQFTCRETEPGICDPGACEPCWTEENGKFYLMCLCDAFCDGPDLFKPPKLEDFESQPSEPELPTGPG